MSKAFLQAATVFLLCLVAAAQEYSKVIRVGAFPNITHAQAMVGTANGWFDRAMGPQVKVQWTSFNAGPSAIEALFAGAIDMSYVGPNSVSAPTEKLFVLWPALQAVAPR